MSFQEKKSKLREIFIKLIGPLKLLDEIVETMDMKNPILKKFLDKNVKFNFKSIIEGLEVNLRMIERDKMKCVFFGKTSNGKSCVINALIGSKILPSGMGRSTSCFINVTGTDENVGFLVDRNGKKRDVTMIKKLADELSEDRCDIESILSVCLPRNDYDILRNDVEMLDCPGSDYTSDNDSWIIKYCEDADVFVLVIHGPSTLSESERSLFIKLKRHVLRPNVIVLVNQWDLVETSGENDTEKIRKQHLQEVSKLLVNVLKIYSSDEVKDRIFFISALKSLERKAYDSCENEQFRAFEKSLQNELNEHAIQNKFKEHYRKGQEVVNTTLEYLSIFPHYVSKMKTFDESELNNETLANSKNLIAKVLGDIAQDCRGVIDLESLQLATNILKAIEKKSGGIERILNIKEEYLASKICEIFSTKVNTLPDGLQNIFMESSCIKLSADQIKSFLNLHFNMKEPIRKFENDIHSNMKNISNEMKTVLEPQHNNLEILKKLREVLQVTSPILNAGGTAVTRYSTGTAIGLSIFGAITNVAGTILDANNSQTNFEEEIINELHIFFNDLINVFLMQISGVLDNMVTKVVDEYMKDQYNMNDLLEKFNDFKEKFERIQSKLSRLN